MLAKKHFPYLLQSSVLCVFVLALLVYPAQAVSSSKARGVALDPQDIVEEFVSVDSSARDDRILKVYEELFKLAYEKAPEIHIARSQKNQKKQESYTAKAKRFSPAVEGSLSQVHELNYKDTSSASTTYQDDSDYADWGVSMELPLFNKPLGVALKVALGEERLAENTLLVKTQELDLTIKELLGNYLESTYRLFNIRNSVKLSGEHVSKVFRGFELRDQTKLQLLRAKANHNDLETRLDLDEQAQEVAFRKLLDFSGLDGHEPVFEKLETLLQSEIDIAGCINSLAAIGENYTEIQHYVEMSEAGERLKFFQENSLLHEKIVLEQMLADYQAQVFTQDEWFDVAVRGSYDRREDTRFSDYDGEGTLSLVLSVPLFTGGTSLSSYKSKAMAHQVAGVNKGNDLRVRVHAIENSRKLISSLLKVLVKQQVNLKQQKEIVVLSFKSYQIKQTSMQDLLTSQNALIDAKNSLMETTNQLGSLIRQFAWELGKPYPFPNVDSESLQ